LSNLLGFIGDASERVDRGEKADVVFLGFKKAFDTVPHARLMVELVVHGVEGKLLIWIGEWLNGKKQRLVIDREESGWMEVISGVLKGSVLGPILFTVFVNDLDSAVVNRVWKFSDDVTMIGNV